MKVESAQKWYKCCGCGDIEKYNGMYNKCIVKTNWNSLEMGRVLHRQNEQVIYGNAMDDLARRTALAVKSGGWKSLRVDPAVALAFITKTAEEDAL